MKRFIYSTGGKTILYFVTLIGAVITILLSAGALFMLNEGFYTTPQDEKIHEIRQAMLIDDARNVVESALFDDVYIELDSFDWEILNENGAIYASNISSYYSGSAETEIYEMHFACVFRDAGCYAYYYIPGNDQPQFVEDAEFFTVLLIQRDGSELLEPYRIVENVVRTGYNMLYSIYALVFLGLILSTSAFVGLMCGSARRNDVEDLVPGPLHRVPLEILLAITLGPLLIGYAAAIDWTDGLEVPIMVISGILLLAVLIGLSMSISARIKTHTLWKNTLVGIILRLFGKFFGAIGRGIAYVVRHIPMIWRGMIAVTVVVILEMVMIAWYGDGLCDFGTFVLFWIFEKMLLVPLVLYALIAMRRLEKGGEELASGNLKYKISLGGLWLGFRKHAKNLNCLSDTINVEVEERLKSERMKTELITNVSHDIKTPLTSIINYSDLISKEPSENPKITEYSEVLTRQSNKLKRLIEDLVEVSKANSGNLEIEPVPCDANVFLSQSVGEYEDRLAETNLTVVVETQPEPVTILADPRRMWRVFDNLLSNVCKYTLEGTRVYLSLEVIAGQACITLKNISREALNISADELTERFVRGDKSRNTEGNGLGLSIARSLVELQGGTFDVQIDGDLFKVFLSFPLVHGDRYSGLIESMGTGTVD